MPPRAMSALLLIGITLVACYMPARRAMQVDPLLTMRGEQPIDAHPRPGSDARSSGFMMTLHDVA